ncbi:MAG: DUF2063 domain-containing protein [Sphingobium sp.]|nr:MAG: DUF2063 domain-containing protein [Sphingobium sp.]
MSLLTMQRDFGAWLRTGAEEDGRRVGRAYAPGLRIHQNNYRTQLIACLETGFAQTRRWIGDAAFHRAAALHIDRMPPCGWTLDTYGHDFPVTLAMLYPGDPDVAELAALERALEDAFVARNRAPFPAASMADVDWDRAVLIFSPSVIMADLTTNAPAIWSALAHEQEPPAAQALDIPASLLVWRADGVSCFRHVDGAEQHILREARNGTGFAGLCDMLARELGPENGIAAAGAMLGRWVADGLIVAVETPA